MISEVYPAVDQVGWYGLFAPAGTPPAGVRRVSVEMNRIAQLPEVRAQFRSVALRPVPGTPEDLAALLRKDYDSHGQLVRTLNLRLD